MNESVRVEWPEAAHARLVLARPERRNALGLAELQALALAVKAIGARSPRVLSIVADGGAFSVGGDIEAFAASLAEGRMVAWLREAGSHINAAIAGLHALDAAIVCGVQGSVAGGALGIVWAANHVVAADDLQLNMAYPRIGASPDAGTSWFLPRLVNPLKAFELMALAPTLGAQEALAQGLVSQCVTAARLRQTVDDVAARLLRVPPVSLRNIKSLLRRSLTSDLHSQLAEEIDAFARAADQPEFAEKVKAFLANRRGP
jgi:2-(1,2-epoxy-1,2-dihydrophenyl)acetyl-CoA isomerase